jgi:hypothetical protein
MSDICNINYPEPNLHSQEIIKISPELQRIFNAHFEKIYILHFFYGHIKTYRTKPAIDRTIVSHYREWFDRHTKLQDVAQWQMDRFRKSLNKFLADFRQLSFTDVDLLIQLNENEINNFPITTINGKPIELEE